MHAELTVIINRTTDTLLTYIENMQRMTVEKVNMHSAKNKTEKAIDSTWVVAQNKGFTRWVNEQIKSRIMAVDSAEGIEGAFADGIRLPALIEELKGGKTIFKVNAKKIRNRFQVMASLNAVLDHLHRVEGMSLINISAEDIYGRSTKLSLGLVWTLIRHFHIQSSLGEDSAEGADVTTPVLADKSTDREKLMRRLNAIYTHRGQKPIRNFKCDFVSADRFTCLLGHLRDTQRASGGCVRTDATVDGMQDFGTQPVAVQFALVFKAAEEEFEIPQLLDAEDMAARDFGELIVMTYTTYFLKAHHQLCGTHDIVYASPNTSSDAIDPVGSDMKIADVLGERTDRSRVLALDDQDAALGEAVGQYTDPCVSVMSMETVPETTEAKVSHEQDHATPATRVPVHTDPLEDAGVDAEECIPCEHADTRLRVCAGQQADEVCVGPTTVLDVVQSEVTSTPIVAGQSDGRECEMEADPELVGVAQAQSDVAECVIEMKEPVDIEPPVSFEDMHAESIALEQSMAIRMFSEHARDEATAVWQALQIAPSRTDDSEPRIHIPDDGEVRGVELEPVDTFKPGHTEKGRDANGEKNSLAWMKCDVDTADAVERLVLAPSLVTSGCADEESVVSDLSDCATVSDFGSSSTALLGEKSGDGAQRQNTAQARGQACSGAINKTDGGAINRTERMSEWEKSFEEILRWFFLSTLVQGSYLRAR
ncbi:hypothetical protein SARC_01778 [Sphaeroforma arctica JP610]|uniref:Calponin-homology (CH) domain-containing protein n=1 Tax=Sphaeroforma arctica JP610 TaxID=667725 RepID=A0A0L0GCU3_9EUKA|nr:hypothetical protein SARC_01778 [Sphaeroforma arctica JP610]KNC86053.1 hypothetical protein SARC_01778 [Sphaeroforma arctica JP610]|eukprot:XP_014159955.1 hypothetical protein SARC_01778 [Sphaeroforma arctica JP610]